jgi:hypothetical protein
VKESEFVRRFQGRLVNRYGKESLYFYKIPTGKFGGFRPYDAVMALRFREKRRVVLHHFVLEFKVQRSTIFTAERLFKEARHQYMALVEAKQFFCPVYVIYEEKSRSLRLLYVGDDEAQFSQVRFLDVWTSTAKVEKAELPPEEAQEESSSDA